MDLGILKKKLSSYRTKAGRMRKLPPELQLEVLRVWESWTGTFKQLAAELGLRRKQLAPVIGKAKKLLQEGALLPEADFTELTSSMAGGAGVAGASAGAIELLWDHNRVIRFYSPEQLIVFLKMAA